MQHRIPLKPHASIDTLTATLKSARGDILRTRLKAIILRARDHTPQEIAERLLVNDRSVRDWITLYNDSGIAGLSPKPSGRTEGNPKWDSVVFTELATEIDKGGYWSIPRMQEWIHDTHRVDIPEQTVWYRMDKLKYSYKGARPHPVQGDIERQDTFKKGASLPSWSR
jgi:transposase